ncbi:MAG: methylase domain protein [Ignavibacteria bacterium]|nr:methylase domain protein [Ignavibacteria bacterium]
MSGIFSDFDFNTLNSPDFKEDSVREVIILPILYKLGFDNSQIIRSKSLRHPFVKIGSKKRNITVIPDYLLKIGNNYAWVLDAKSPSEDIKSGDHIEQIYSYSIHPEIRAKFFALCNGREFILFRPEEEKPILYFNIQEIDNYWDVFSSFLSPDSFHGGKKYDYNPQRQGQNKTVDYDYLKLPLLDEIPVRKRAAKRHFGVHGYFTKQSWNVVHEYIRTYTQPGDLVLDPFSGSGITVIESLMLDRKAIHVDLNPLSGFIVEALTSPVNISELNDSFQKIITEFEKKAPKNEHQYTKILNKYPFPKGLQLPKGSDVETIEQLFCRQQLAELAYLKHLILQEKNKNIRKSLLLAFSSTVNKINLTYHHSTYAGPNAGNSGPMMYYRYRIASNPTSLDIVYTFTKKVNAVLNAKKDIEFKINENTINNLQIINGSATDLSFIKTSSIDYIYTDPPYGKKIPYLDLSIMWNAWLDLKVTDEDYRLEAIEGGEQNKTKQEYNQLITKSIEEMYRVLKYDRWMSFVFAHKDPEFWHLIIDTAERCGFEYAGAVAQKNGQTSFKKRQHPFTVLSGQLIINFKKVNRPKYILKAALGIDIGEIVLQTIEGIIAKNHGATLEQINDELIIKGLELGFLDLLKKEYSDLTPFLLDNFDYSEKTELFTIKITGRFKTQIDVKLRVKYYIISYLRRLERENKSPTFDEIVLHILPLLKNGITPEEQTILNVLENEAEHIGNNRWKLKIQGQQTMEFFQD